MLVRAYQHFILVGYADVSKRKLFKKVIERKEIFHEDVVAVICDETEVTEKIACAIQTTKDHVYPSAIKFYGWHDCITTNDRWEEVPKHVFRRDLNKKFEYIKDWRMETVSRLLTAEQYAQLSKELDIRK